MPINVTLQEIIDYGDHSHRPFIEGDKIFKAKHIISAGIVRRDGATVTVIGLVLQTSHPKALPHEVTLKIVRVPAKPVLAENASIFLVC